MDKVMVGACRCPGAPHAEDWVEMHPQVPILVGSTVLSGIRAAGGDESRILALMARAYVMYGPRAWSFVDKDGDPIRVDPTQAGWADLVDELLPWDMGGAEVADAGDALYSERVMRPLMVAPSTSSQPMSMDAQTSVSQPTGRKPRKRSAPSLQTVTAGTPSEALAP